jgi:hypothetical protein
MASQCRALGAAPHHCAKAGYGRRYPALGQSPAPPLAPSGPLSGRPRTENFLQVAGNDRGANYSPAAGTVMRGAKRHHCTTTATALVTLPRRAYHHFFERQYR